MRSADNPFDSAIGPALKRLQETFFSASTSLPCVPLTMINSSSISAEARHEGGRDLIIDKSW